LNAARTQAAGKGARLGRMKIKACGGEKGGALLISNVAPGFMASD